MTEDDMQNIQSGLDEIKEMFAFADQWVKDPDLGPTLDRLRATLDPYCDPAYKTPEVPLQLGILYTSLGSFLDAEPPQESMRSESFFARAADYFWQAARMQSLPSNDFVPSQAKLQIAQFYLAGLIGDERDSDLSKAFGLTLLAAQEGSAEAQFSVALAYAEGLGTDSSPTNAVFWINAAQSNSAQLDADMKEIVTSTCERFEAFYMETSQREDPREKVLELIGARMQAPYTATYTMH